MDKSLTWIFCLMCIIFQFDFGSSDGRLYVGILTYNNEGNKDYYGNCCDDTGGTGLKCEMFCDLIFQVSVFSLDGRNITNRSFSHDPISDFNRIEFGELQELDLANPLVFDFQVWPGEVSVVISVYDHDDKPAVGDGGDDVQLVDVMRFDVTVAAHSPMFTYVELEGERPGQKSVLGAVFRYDCEVFYAGRKCGNACAAESQIGCTKPISTDCTGFTTGTSSIETTATTSSVENTTNMTTSYATETTTTFNKPTTESSTFESSASSELTTEQSTSTHVHKSTSPSPAVSSSSPEVTVSPPEVTATSPEVAPSSPEVALSSPEVASSSLEVTSSSRPPSHKKPTTVVTVFHGGATTLDPPSFSPTLGSPFLPRDMDSWEIILGSVLGAAALVSVVGYLVFYNRQKSLLRRKEVYSVTPEMLSIVEENGITVRSDIPVETNSSST